MRTGKKYKVWSKEDDNEIIELAKYYMPKDIGRMKNLTKSQVSGRIIYLGKKKNKKVYHSKGVPRFGTAISRLEKIVDFLLQQYPEKKWDVFRLIDEKVTSKKSV